jgi:uncharacterized protein (UPF0332 family)
LRSIAPNARRAREHLDKAHKNLRAMQGMFREEHFDWTVVCGYYAMYHAVLAALSHIGIAASSHGCAVAAFRRFYVERGHAPARYTAFLKRAQQLTQRYADSLEEARRNRITVQYEIEELTNDDAEWMLEEAKDFVLEIEAVLA